MPAEAGIQSFIEINNFKDLVSRLYGKDGVSSIVTQSLERGDEGEGDQLITAIS
jgi:hypothetical protein